MEWKKAKTIIMVALIIVNAILFVANRYYYEDYSMSQSEEKAIYDLLEKNNITLNTSLIKSYDPMSRLSVTVSLADTDKMKDIFFDKDESVETTMEFEQRIFTSFQSKLIIEGNKIRFTSITGKGDLSVLSKDSAQILAESFLSKLGDEYSGYILDTVTFKNGGYQLEYYEYFKGYKIFCNYCKFFIDDNGIKSIESENYKIDGFVDDTQEIVSVGEALLSYVYLRGGSNINRIIEDIRIGYDIEQEEGIVDGTKVNLVPCYNIYELSYDDPIVVYAYNNDIKNN